MKVRYGLIGYGRWGALHASSIRRSPNGELAAIAVSSEETAARVKVEQGVDVYTDVDLLLQRKDIDVVDIVVPNHLHYEVGMKALRAGKHLLMEKPLALTLEHCREMTEEAEKRGLLVHVGHENHFSSLWGSVRTKIDDGELGQLKTVRIHLSRHAFRDGRNGWRKDAVRVGSWILEEPIHYLELLRWYFQGQEQPVTVYAAGNSREPRLEAERLYENLFATVTFSKGGVGFFSQTLAAYEHHLTAEFIGTGGALKLWWSGATDEVREPQFRMERFDGQTKQEVPVERTPGEVFELDRQIEVFSDIVLNGGRPTVNAEDGMWAVKLSLAAQQSADSGKIVSLEEME